MYTKILLPLYGKKEFILLGNETLDIVAKKTKIELTTLVNFAEEKVTEFLKNTDMPYMSEELLQFKGKTGTLQLKVFNGSDFRVSFDFIKGV